ncbi:DUF481 domain-containing protein [Mucilaginibacter defluvii]|uniref:DUF481 domain-containing protein n=1 Tax=Mucilaginibacter defluvii TaxID=1196019 RepID=A0ABP9FUY7_9SPHI
MRIKTIALHLALLPMFFTGKTFAQFTDSTHYRVNYTSSGSINKTGDGTAYLLNNSAGIGIKKKNISLNFNNTWIYGRQRDALTNNDFSTALDFNLYKTFPHFFFWGLANYNTSYSLKINNQLLAGLGAAYNIVDKPNAWLNISNGILYDKSDLMLNDTAREDYHTYRNSLRIAFKFTINKLIVLESSSFLQNSLNKGDDYIIRSNNSLSFKMSKWLALTAALGYNRQNRTKSENLLFTYGLTLEKYFK